MSVRKKLLKQQKKALIYMLSAVIGTTTLTGCGNQFDYQYEEDGTVTVEGTISYGVLKNAKLVHLTNELAEIDEYLLVLYHPDGRYAYATYYYDIENGFEFYLETDKYKNFKMDIILDSMIDFLYKYDMVKDEYSIDDVLKLKELLLEEEKLFRDDLKTSSVKVLSKRKILS